jgi:branched-chain amino acid transport system substrate-binding protein
MITSKLIGARASIVGTALAICIAMAGSASAEALKIALIEPLSGALEKSGYAFAEGVRYGVKKMNASGGFNGQPVELKEYDNAGQATVLVDRLKQAINDGDRIVLSGTISAFGAILTDEIKKYNERNPGKEVIYYNIGSGSIDLVAEKCHFWSFKFAGNAWVFFGTAARGMNEANALGKRVYLINPNYSYGRDAEKAQREVVEKLGGEVVGSDLIELGKTQDFSPYVAKMKAAGATSILTGNFEKDLTLLMKTKADAGLNIPLSSQSLDSPGTVASAGDAALQAYLPKNWVRGAGDEAGDAFDRDFTTLMGHPPIYEMPTAAFPTLFLGEALKKVDFKGGALDMKQVALAIENTTWHGPTGDWTMRKEDHQNIQPFTLSVVSKDAKYKLDGIDMGFKIVKIVPATDVALPVSPACKMDRPS